MYSHTHGELLTLSKAKVWHVDDAWFGHDFDARFVININMDSPIREARRPKRSHGSRVCQKERVANLEDKASLPEQRV